MSDLVFASAVFNGSFQHLSIYLSDQRDRAKLRECQHTLHRQTQCYDALTDPSPRLAPFDRRDGDIVRVGQACHS